MKYIIIFILSLSFVAVNAQESKPAVAKAPVEQKETFKVDGVCLDCKARIENAALIKGVKFVEWSKETHDLVVIFKPAKVTLDEIKASIAKAGHQTKGFEADEKAYSNLPGCCEYKNGAKCEH